MKADRRNASRTSAFNFDSGKFLFGRNLEFRRPEEFSLLIQNKERLGSLRVWFLPELKKLRYDAGIRRQELSAIDRAEQTVVFQTSHRQQYSVRELCDLMLGQIEKPRFDGPTAIICPLEETATKYIGSFRPCAPACSNINAKVSGVSSTQ